MTSDNSRPTPSLATSRTGERSLTRRIMVGTAATIAVAAVGGALFLRSGLPGTSQLIQRAVAETATSPGATARTDGPATTSSTSAMDPKLAAKSDGPTSTTPAALLQFTQQFKTGGVSKCLGVTQGLGQFAMGGVTEYGSTSTWHAKQPDARLLSAMVGEKFASAPGVGELHGVSAVMAAPTPDGKCDGATVQIIPSPLSCQTLQTQVLVKGKQLSSLAGLPLLQDVNNQRMMLLPTAGNGCVVIGFNNVYAD